MRNILYLIITLWTLTTPVYSVLFDQSREVPSLFDASQVVPIMHQAPLQQKYYNQFDPQSDEERDVIDLSQQSIKDENIVDQNLQLDSPLNSELFVAIEHDNHQEVESLLLRGAQIGAINSCKKTLLQWAFQFAKAPTVKVLLDAGAKFTPTDLDFVVPRRQWLHDPIEDILALVAHERPSKEFLKYALRKSERNIVEILVQAGIPHDSADTITARNMVAMAEILHGATYENLCRGIITPRKTYGCDCENTELYQRYLYLRQNHISMNNALNI